MRWWQERQNKTYARRCVRHALSLGEAPLASHLLYTQPGIVRDGVLIERAWGISAGLKWIAAAEASVVYIDRGVSGGMRMGIKAAHDAGVRVEYRSIYRERVADPVEEREAYGVDATHADDAGAAPVGVRCRDGQTPSGSFASKPAVGMG